MRNFVIALGFAAAAIAAASVAPAQEPKPAAGAPGAPPPSPCTGLPETQCGTVASCVWLPGYKVASGAEVAGYCRPAPKPLNARRPASPQQ